MNELRLWGWLSPDAPDALAGAPMAEALAATLGLASLQRTPPVPLDVSKIPASRLNPRQLAALQKALGSSDLSTTVQVRAACSLGQSYPDQLARRAGKCRSAVDGVAYPASHDEAQALLDCAVKNSFRVMPVGGATSVVGGLTLPDAKRPVIAADLSRMNSVLQVSARDMTVTTQAGIRLPQLEAKLSESGLTLGHFPQSFHGASLGGSIAASGAGQRSDGYCRLSERLLQARLATPSGEWRSEPVRHSAAGPWLGGLVCGSEGLFGIVTEATMALSPKPQKSFDAGWLFASFEQAVEAARALAQDGPQASMVRISDVTETHFLAAFRLARAGLSEPGLAERALLAVKRAPKNPCLLLAGFEGTLRHFPDALLDLRFHFRRHGGVALGERPGKSWQKNRFEAPHLREALMARGLGVDTYETAAPWSAIAGLHQSVSTALGDAIAKSSSGNRGIVMCHLSHSYADAACLYFTAVFTRAKDALEQWRMIKQAATGAIVASGATVSHHHGMGADHAPFATTEKGEKGILLLQAIAREFDPGGIMATGMQAALD